jgi:hypothetical protein
VRQYPDKSVAEIISAGKKVGLKIRPNLVHNVRHWDKKRRANQAQAKRGLKTRRRKLPGDAELVGVVRGKRGPKVVPEAALQPPPKADALPGQEFAVFSDAVSDFLLGVMHGLREVVRAEIRDYFAPLGMHRKD